MPIPTPRKWPRDLKSLLDRLVYFIKEREEVRLKKELDNPKPWTADPILRTYKFTNVRRMDDQVSRWLMDNWYTPYRDHQNMLAAVVLARHFNLPNSLTRITHCVFGPGQPRWDAVKQIMRELKKGGMTIFNGAYMVRGIGTADKTEMVVDRVARPLFEASQKEQVVYRTSMQKTHEALTQFWGMGSFMAGQVVADLRWALSGTWADRNDWAPVGPGSARGLARLLYGDEWQAVARRFAGNQDDFLFDFAPLTGRLRKRLPKDLSDRLEAMDFQNCLCEFDKYNRALLDEGRPKQRYDGG